MVDQEIEIDSLLTQTQALMQKMVWVRRSFGLKPDKEHPAGCINYSDLLPMRKEFLAELVSNITRYVYSAKGCERLREKLGQGRDAESASALLGEEARAKFRKCDSRGQFSELLLFVFLQHHFKAAPLVRKMPITTDPEHERNGADAIHIGKDESEFVLYLGEAKTYHRKEHSFEDALRDSIKSILEQYRVHREELQHYTYDGFLDETMQGLAEAYISGELSNLRVELVCMVTFNDDAVHTHSKRAEIIQSIFSEIERKCGSLSKGFFDKVPNELLPRMNYILFPVQDLNALTDSFSKYINGA